jgi:DNA-binding GntR family transcriptional regulator
MVDGDEIAGFERLSEIFGVDMQMGNGSKFVKTEYVHENPSAYCESYLPAAYFPEAYGLLEKNSCSFDLLSGKIPLGPRSAKCRLTITSADKKKGEAMGITTGTSLIKLESRLINGRGMTVEYCICHYRTTGTEILFNKIRKI